MTKSFQPLSQDELSNRLFSDGHARLGQVLTPDRCIALRALYDRDELFRSTIEMARYRFGEGSYRYFKYPLPDDIERLRQTHYRLLAPLAAEWMKALKIARPVPAELEDFLAICHARGQKRPTPLLLHYEAGGYNCLHQDVYGAVVFPFQVIVALSEPSTEYDGGELLLVEQRPRAQSIGHALRLGMGEALAIATRFRPAKGARGHFRTNLRNGVSRVLRGERYTLGIIFHDAE